MKNGNAFWIVNVWRYRSRSTSKISMNIRNVYREEEDQKSSEEWKKKFTRYIIPRFVAQPPILSKSPPNVPKINLILRDRCLDTQFLEWCINGKFVKTTEDFIDFKI